MLFLICNVRVYKNVSWKKVTLPWEKNNTCFCDRFGCHVGVAWALSVVVCNVVCYRLRCCLLAFSEPGSWNCLLQPVFHATVVRHSYDDNILIWIAHATHIPRNRKFVVWRSNSRNDRFQILKRSIWSVFGSELRRRPGRHARNDHF